MEAPSGYCQFDCRRGRRRDDNGDCKRGSRWRGRICSWQRRGREVNGQFDLGRGRRGVCRRDGEQWSRRWSLRRRRSSWQRRGRDGDGDSTARGGGAAMAVATATGGAAGKSIEGATPGTNGAANASSTATSDHGAIAQAQSTAVGSSGEAQSTAGTSFTNVKVRRRPPLRPAARRRQTRSLKPAGPVRLSAIPARRPTPSQSELPARPTRRRSSGARARSPTRCSGRATRSSAPPFLTDYAPDGGGETDTYSATTTFDFGYRGDLLLGPH